MKTVNYIFKKPATHHVGDGFIVSNYIPGQFNLQQKVSPFVMLDYNAPYDFAPSQHKRGVGAHPHRGFETVTLVYKGELEHRDTSGAGGKISDGEVQWMTAASGVLHEEFQSETFANNGGIQHVVQLWVNLPAKYKMSAPKYQSLTKQNIPEVKLENNGGVVRVIAGEYAGVKGSASTFSPVEMYDVRLNPGAATHFDLPENNNTIFLVTKGSITVNGDKKAHDSDLVLFNHDGRDVAITTDEESYVLVLSGAPLDEPIASYGPFVMNTKEEIIQAMEDFNSGKFGELHSEGYAHTKTMKQQ